jgi:phosphoglycerate dehydrogenase-like enzyme
LKAKTIATIAGGEPYTARVFENARTLRIVARWGVGYDKVDVSSAIRANIPVAKPLPADSPLRSLDNVLLSPHVSGMDKMAECKVTERCVSNILNFLSGQKKTIRPYVVNPETLMEIPYDAQDRRHHSRNADAVHRSR